MKSSVGLYMTPISIYTFIEMLFPKHIPPGSSIAILLDKMGWIGKRRESGKEKERHKIEGGGKEKRKRRKR